MAKGYPSRRRARKAFERGVKDGQRRRSGRNPYLNQKLSDLYLRGYLVGTKLPAAFPDRRTRGRARAFSDRSGDRRHARAWGIGR